MRRSRAGSARRCPVIRTMPNRPALNGFGATGLFAPPSVGAANRALAEMIMAAVSATVWVEHESQMDTVTAALRQRPGVLFLVHGSARGGRPRTRTARRGRPPFDAGNGVRRRANGARNRGTRSPPCASRSPRRAGRPPRRSRSSTPPAFVLSSRMRWRRPTAARPNSPPSSAPPRIRHRSAMEAIRYIVDMLLWLLRWPSCCGCCSNWCGPIFAIRWPMPSCASPIG